MNAAILNTNSSANMSLIVELAKKLNIEVLSISQKELEEIEDLKLLRKMNESLAGGLADRDEVFKELGR